MREQEGVFLLEHGLLYLDPAWINELLRALLDHRLQESASDAYWEEELDTFCKAHHKVNYSPLWIAHKTFCATGVLTVSYLYFLWRKVREIWEDGVFERLLKTMCAHGVLFSKLGAFSRNADAFGVESSATLFVPVRLKSFVTDEELEGFSGPCVINEWRRQFVLEILQSYVPPGIVGMIMTRLLSYSSHVQFHCAWRRGISFMMGGSEVMIYLSPPTTELAHAEIEVNVVGAKRSDEVEAKVNVVKSIVEGVLQENFPGLFYRRNLPVSREGKSALMSEIKSLQAHLDVKLDVIDGRLVDVAKTCRESLSSLQHMHSERFPYPLLVVIREKKAGSKKAGDSSKKCILSKTMFNSLSAKIRRVGMKDMRLQFRCPFDFSDVPCGPGGEGYSFGEARNWVKMVMPAVKVRAQRYTLC